MGWKAQEVRLVSFCPSFSHFSDDRFNNFSLYYEPSLSFVDLLSEEGAKEVRRHKKKLAFPTSQPQQPQLQQPAAEGEETHAVVEEVAKSEEEPLLNRIKLISKNKAVSLNVDTQMITLASGHKIYYEKVPVSPTHVLKEWI